ncbi:MAG TPA: MgtC/SapB family protein [Novosphingobium sp.]|nr:MgtC/SapB family protein [Novosphingobium sp.]
MQSLNLPELTAIGLALALGLLIGVQRGWATRDEKPGSRFAGIRTHALFGLAGGIAGALQGRAAVFSAVLLGASAALVVMGYWRSTRGQASISGTATLTGLITLACGFLAGSGDYALASALTGTTVVVLSQRSRWHHWLAHIDEREMLAIARFALIALVILPLLPNSPIGPYGAWRPRQLWLVVVLVSGFSFAGYAAVKLLGPARGVLATAAAGSMVSSTAVTASLAGKLRDGSGDPMLLNAGVALASATMFLRVMLLTAALARFALPGFATVAAPGMMVSLAACWLILRKAAPAGTSTDSAVSLRNPFDLPPALLLAGLTMALTLAARWVLDVYGDAGLALVLAISGTVDVDSAIITMGNLPPGTLTARTAALVLAVPVVLNTLFKTATLIGLAGWRKAWPGASAMLASLVALGGGVLVVF